MKKSQSLPTSFEELFKSVQKFSGNEFERYKTITDWLSNLQNNLSFAQFQILIGAFIATTPTTSQSLLGI